MTRMIIPALALVAVACPPPGTTLDHLVADHRAETGVAYEACGEMARTTSCGVDTAALQCFVDAADVCAPATLRVEDVTVEGALIVEVYFVEPSDGDGCEITLFRDTHRDPFRDTTAPALARHACVGIQDADSCIGVFPAGCQVTGAWDALP